MDCNHLTLYLDRCLKEKDREQFEVHLDHCVACRNLVDGWHKVTGTIKLHDERHTTPRIDSPSEDDIQRLIHQAASTRTAAPETESPSPSQRNRYGLVSAAAAMLLLGIVAFIWWHTTDSERSHRGVSSPNDTQIIATTQPPPNFPTHAGQPASEETAPIPTFANDTQTLVGNETLQTASRSGKCVYIASDTVCLYPDSRADTQITPAAHHVQLKAGRALFHVTPGQSRQFRVDTPRGTITVVGTRFSVALDPSGRLDVLVKKGTVRVESEQHTALLNAGDAASVEGSNEINTRNATERELAMFVVLDSHISSNRNIDANSDLSTPNSRREIAASSLPSLDVWRQRMIQGDLDPAIDGLTRHWQKYPVDTDAAFLLATCLKRKGLPKETMAIYQKLTRNSRLSVSNRAAYLAGDLCLHQLHDPSCALRYFTPFLENSTPSASHRAEASYYKAEALLQLGRKKEAEQILQNMVQTYGRTAIGQRANDLLHSMQP